MKLIYKNRRISACLSGLPPNSCTLGDTTAVVIARRTKNCFASSNLSGTERYMPFVHSYCRL